MDFKFPSTFKAIIGLFLQIFKTPTNNGEEFALKLLKTKFDFSFYEIIKNVTGPFAFFTLVILIFGVLFSFPALFLTKFCARPVNATKKQISFCLETFLLLSSITFLILGALSYGRISMESNKVIEEYPKFAVLTAETLENNLKSYNLQLNELIKSREDAYDGILIQVSEMSKKFEEFLENLLGNDLQMARILISDSFKEISVSEKHLLMENEDSLNFLNYYLCEEQHFNETINSTDDNKTTADDKKLLLEILQGAWKELNFQNFDKTFEENYQEAQKFITIELEIYKNQENLSQILLEDFFKDLQNFTATIKHFCIKQEQSIQHYNRFLNFPLLVLLIPTFYALFFVSFLICNTFIAIADFKTIFLKPETAFLYKSKSLKYLKVITWTTVIFLSVFFATALLFYTLYWPSEIFCQLLKERTIFSGFLDDSRTWNGSTWLGQKLQKYQFQKQENNKADNLLKLSNILNRCSENKSIINIFSLEKDFLRTFDFSIDLKGDANLENPFNLLNFEINIEEINNLTKLPISQQIYETACLKHSSNQTETAETFKLLRENADLILWNWSLETIKENLQIFHLYQKRLQRRTEILRKAQINNFLDHFLKSLIQQMETSKKSTEIFIEHQTENCFPFAEAFDNLQHLVCNHLCYTLIGSFGFLTLIAISMSISLVLLHTIRNYISGTLNYYKFTDERYNSEKSKFIALQPENSSLKLKLLEDE